VQDNRNISRSTRVASQKLKRKFLLVNGAPASFTGKVELPPSKSYLHRALFIAALCKGPSHISECSQPLSDDVSATVNALRTFGCKIEPVLGSNKSIAVYPHWKLTKKFSVFCGGSGTTARLVTAFAALAPKGSLTRITGNESLSKRPMQAVLTALNSLGVSCESEKKNGSLPVSVSGGGIPGGRCEIDGSISSQFVSALLISTTKADRTCSIKIRNPSRLVSRPYISATIKVLEHYGFHTRVLSSERFQYTGFITKGQQVANGKPFRVPGDMSAAGALIGATISAKGEVELKGIDLKLPQSDSVFLSFANNFGGRIRRAKGSLLVSVKSPPTGSFKLNLQDSPDLVPAIAGSAAGAGVNANIFNVGHLKFKESDRLHTLERELGKLGIRSSSTSSTLSVFGAQVRRTSSRKPILLDSKDDHRMLMAFTIAALSGRFGPVTITNPDCVAKSYPGFVKDIQQLCGERSTVKIVSR
jgi:3-phosphoshikimate 1-carboxyvinyltransferase